MSSEFRASASEPTVIIDTTHEHAWGATKHAPVTALSLLQRNREDLRNRIGERLGQLESYQQQITRITARNAEDTATLASVDEAIAKLEAQPITLSADEARIINVDGGEAK